MLTPYLASIHLIERLHRQFLELVKAELDSMGEETVNNVQALILFNIGKDQMTVGELTQRGYYQGSNVSYNVKKLVENGYLLQEPSPHDKRSIRIKLSDKGLELWAKMVEVFERQTSRLNNSEVDSDELTEANNILFRLENLWSDMLKQSQGSPFNSGY